jgi:hypothetical protein
MKLSPDMVAAQMSLEKPSLYTYCLDFLYLATRGQVGIFISHIRIYFLNSHQVGLVQFFTSKSNTLTFICTIISLLVSEQQRKMTGVLYSAHFTNGDLIITSAP